MFVLQSLCSNYLLGFTAVAMVAAVIAHPQPLLTRDRGRVVAILAAAGVASVVLLLPVLVPYYLVTRDQGLAWSLDEVRQYSATTRDYLATLGRFHFDAWSSRYFNGSTPLFPGITATLLALVGIVAGPGLKSPRVRMAIAFGVIGVALSIGPGLPGYAWLHAHVPIVGSLESRGPMGLARTRGDRNSCGTGSGRDRPASAAAWFGFFWIIWAHQIRRCRGAAPPRPRLEPHARRARPALRSAIRTHGPGAGVCVGDPWSAVAGAHANQNCRRTADRDRAVFPGLGGVPHVVGRAQRAGTLHRGLDAAGGDPDRVVVAPVSIDRRACPLPRPPGDQHHPDDPARVRGPRIDGVQRSRRIRPHAAMGQQPRRSPDGVSPACIAGPRDS
jgi:hypothetical protein